MAKAIWTVTVDMGEWTGCWKQVTPKGRVLYVLAGDLITDAELESHDYFEDKHDAQGCGHDWDYDEGDEDGYGWENKALMGV
jgi:hypothetical protein